MNTTRRQLGKLRNHPCANFKRLIVLDLQEVRITCISSIFYPLVISSFHSPLSIGRKSLFTIFMQKNLTEKRICEAYLSLVREPHKKKNISVKEICDKCSIHEQTFYHHFPSKTDLFKYVINHYLFYPKEVSNAQGFLKDLILWLRDNKELMSSLLRMDDFRECLSFVENEQINFLRNVANKEDLLCLDFFLYGLRAVFQETISNDGADMDDSLSLFLDRLSSILDMYTKEKPISFQRWADAFKN